MPRIATRLVGPALVTNAAATRFTVAASELNIIRQIHIINPSAATVNYTASIGADAAGTRIFDTYPIGAGQVFDHWCYYTLVAAEVFQDFAGTNNILVRTVNGERSILG